MLAEAGQNLSRGQRQRIAIARALLSEASFLILDKPTSALDLQHERRFTDTLRSLKRRREADVVCNVAVGTIKSRADRARARLAELLGCDLNELTSDKVTQAALTGPDRASLDVHGP